VLSERDEGSEECMSLAIRSSVGASSIEVDWEEDAVPPKASTTRITSKLVLGAVGDISEEGSVRSVLVK
jgi:hypothetical protein